MRKDCVLLFKFTQRSLASCSIFGRVLVGIQAVVALHTTGWKEGVMKFFF